MTNDIKQIGGMTKKPQNVRLAERGDEQGIFNLLLLLDEENAIWPRSDERVMETIKLATAQQGGIIGVIEDGGKLIGSVGVFLNCAWYTDVWNLDEYWNFVHPDYRRTNYAKDLIDFAKWCNENMGVILSMGIMSTVRTEAKVRLYERKLLKVGAFFMNGVPQERFHV